jgi:hypothetical protein
MSDLVAEDSDGVYVRIGGEKVRPPVMGDPLSLGLEKR